MATPPHHDRGRTVLAEAASCAVNWLHRLNLPPEAPSVAVARGFIGDCLILHGLQALTGDVSLVASELATNAVVHARTPFAISREFDRRCLFIVVADGSPVLPAPVAPTSSDQSGRGLLIVERLAERWGVVRGTDGDRSRAKSVWASFADGPRNPRHTTGRRPAYVADSATQGGCRPRPEPAPR